MSKRASTTHRSIRHRRIRAMLSGTPRRPRLVVFRSLAHIEGQLIDDLAGQTLVAISDRQLKVTGTKTERAMAVGTALAEMAKVKKITSVVFDRGGYKYHGRVKSLAEAARAGGLTF